MLESPSGAVLATRSVKARAQYSAMENGTDGTYETHGTYVCVHDPHMSHESHKSHLSHSPLSHYQGFLDIQLSF